MSPGDEQRTTGKYPEVEKPKTPGSPEAQIAWLRSMSPLLETIPLCCLSAARLDQEFDDQYKRPRHSQWSDEGRKAALAVIQNDRPCKRFTIWIRGLSPKEHLDMDLLDRQQAWQDKREARTLWVNSLFLLATIAAAIAAWWSATHPNVIVVSSPAAAIAPQQIATPNIAQTASIPNTPKLPSSKDLPAAVAPKNQPSEPRTP